MRYHHDVIVVGAGGAGVPLAARLAARGAQVLLLEAGPVPAPVESQDGTSLSAAMPSHPLTISYPGTLFAGRHHTVVRGRVAGGSTTINAGYFRRPRTHDLDSWAARSGDGRWSAKATRPLWAQIEDDQDFGASFGHGTTGPLPVSRGSIDHPVTAALTAAGSALGLPLVLDQNSSPDPPVGVGPVPTNSLNGERWSTARAWLDPAPSGLDVRGGCAVKRVIIDPRCRVTGVEVVVDRHIQILPADLVVLCAGAIETPKLLVRSGIGPADAVRYADVPVLFDAPVGAELHDHPQLQLRFKVHQSVIDAPFRTVIGASAVCTSGVGASETDGDIEVLSLLRPLGKMLGTDRGDNSLSLLVSALRTEAPGRLMFDRSGTPRLDFRYISTADDRARLRAAARLAAAMLASDEVRDLGGEPEHPALLSLDDVDLDNWIRNNLSTSLHSCGTTPMGTDTSTSVVDGRGAVYGLIGLHIADLGILPTTPTSGPAASAVLVGQVIAELL